MLYMANNINVSLRELSEETGIPYKRIKEIVYNHSELTVEEIFCIAKYTKRSPEDVLKIFGL